MEEKQAVVYLRIDERVMNKLRRLAITEKATLGNLASEAIMTWIKWLRKAELKESNIEKAEQKKLEILEANSLLRQIQRKNIRPTLTWGQVNYVQRKLNVIKRRLVEMENSEESQKSEAR